MPRSTRLLTIAVLATAAGLLLPATAPAKTASKHHLGSYRVEQHLTIDELDTQTAHVSCSGSDIAVDGMWRVDDVGHFNSQLADPDELPFDASSIAVRAAYASAVGTYTFAVENPTSDDAQVKLWVVCLRDRTQGGAHSHEHELVSAYTHSSGVLGGTGQFEHTTSPSCASGSVFVAPGFDARDGDAKVYRSAPSSNLRDWSWGFWIKAAGTAVTVSGRCLSLKTKKTGDRLHKLFATRRSSPVDHDDRGNGVWEHRIDCKEDEKGLIGGFDVFAGGHTWDTHSWHWLGMDPRPKSRAYRTLGTGSGGSYWLVCFKDRVSRPLKS